MQRKKETVFVTCWLSLIAYSTEDIYFTGKGQNPLAKKLNVTVNGKTFFEIEISEIKEDSVSSQVTDKRCNKSKPIYYQPVPPKSLFNRSNNEIVSPLCGVVIAVNVKEGQGVKAGDVVAVLDAMKMENEIFAPYDGTVTEAKVHIGDSVRVGDTLFVIA